MKLTRRQFIGSTILSTGATLLTSCVPFRSKSSPLSSACRADFPVDRSMLQGIAPHRFFGPDPTPIHPHLWSRTQQTTPSGPGRIPLPNATSVIEHSGPVVIGGGLSGLAAAYYLRNYNPLVFEATTHFGGNSQGQEWGGIPYSIGAAYFVQPETDTDVHQLLTGLGLLSEIRNPKGEDEYAEGSVLKRGLWKGGVEVYGTKSSGVEQLHKYLYALLKDEAPFRYPDIPTQDSEVRSYVNALDQISFADHLSQIMGDDRIHPISTALEQYCWSAFAASSAEISAAAGLNFLTSELEDIAVLPGGNSRVTERLCQEIQNKLGTQSLRSQHLALNVKAVKTGIELLIIDETGVVHLVKAPAAVVACQKFVAKRIVEGCTPEQYAKMHEIKYRAYLTANVVVKGSPSFSFYDLYLLHRQQGAARLNPATPLTEIAATDAILANWIVGHPTHSVLTLYRALPFDGGRTSVLAEASYGSVRSAFERQIFSELLPLFGLQNDSVIDIRLTRWGHALPVAATHFIASGGPELVSTPIDGRIFFAQQDNWALPAFEVALHEAKRSADAVQRILAKD